MCCDMISISIYHFKSAILRIYRNQKFRIASATLIYIVFIVTAKFEILCVPV